MDQTGSVRINQSTVTGDRQEQTTEALPLWHRVLRVVVPSVSLAGILVGGLVCIAMPIVGGVVAGVSAFGFACYVIGKCIYDRSVRQVSPTQSLNSDPVESQTDTMDTPPLSPDTASEPQEETDDANYVSLIPRSDGDGPAFLPEHLDGDRQSEVGSELSDVYLTINPQDAHAVTVDPEDATRGEHASLSDVDVDVDVDGEEVVDNEPVRPGCSHWKADSPLGLQGPEDDDDYPSDPTDSGWEDVEEPHDGYASLSNIYEYRQSLIEEGQASRMEEDDYLQPISHGQHPLAIDPSLDSLSMQSTDYESIPFDQVSYASCNNQADQLLRIVDLVIEDIAMEMVPLGYYQRAEVLLDEFASEFNQLKVHAKDAEGVLADKIAEIQKHFDGLTCHVHDAMENDYRRSEKYEELINRFYQVAEITLVDNEAQRNKLRMKYEAYRRHALEAENGFVLNTTAYVMRFEREIVDLMNQVGLSERFHANLISRLAEDTTAYTVKQTLLSKEGNWQTVEHVYTPAHQVRFRVTDEESGDEDPFEESYDGKGVPSLDRGNSHAISMYHYQMKVDGHVEDQYTRMGAPIAYTKKTPESIRQGTIKRFKEIVVNVLVNEMAEELRSAINDSNHVVKLNLCYLNLMSPDRLRGKLAKLPLMPKKLKERLDDESEWVNYLAEIIGDMDQILDDGRITFNSVQGQEHSIQLQLSSMMFVIPCNRLGLDGAWSVAGNTWENAKQINVRTLNELKQSATTEGGVINEIFNEMYRESPDDARNWKRNVDELIEKIERKMEEMNGTVSIDEVALLEEDISELCGMLKMRIITGCKSNKDRTSIMKSKKQSSRFDRRMRKNFLVHGGHVQIQINNVNVPGGKYDSTMLEGNQDISRAVKRTSKKYKKSKRSKGKQTLSLGGLFKKRHLKPISSGWKKGVSESSDLRAPPVPKKPEKGLVPPALIGALSHDVSRSSDEDDESLYEPIDALREKTPVIPNEPLKKKRARFFRRR